MVKTKRGRTKRKLEDLIKDVCDIDEVFQQKNKDDDGNEVSNYQKASFEAFSLHARIKARCGYWLIEYNKRCKKEGNREKKQDADDFLKDNKSQQKESSYDD